MTTSTPMQLGQPGESELRRIFLNEAHMAPLKDFVKKLRKEMGFAVTIPDFDPMDGGVNAEILFLMAAPGIKAIESGFVSCDNPDQTAKNLFELIGEAGIQRSHIALWNVVPWYLGDGGKVRAPDVGDIHEGMTFFPELIDLFKNVRAIILLGKKAQISKEIIKIHSNLVIFECPLSSPLFINTNPNNRKKILNTLQNVKIFMGIKT